MKFHKGGNFIYVIQVLSLVYTALIDIFHNVTICIKNTKSNFGNFSLRLRIFSSNFVKNTYFFALGRGPYMGPEYVGTKIPADFGCAIMWSSILHQGSKASGCTETDKEQNMSSWVTFSPSGDISKQFYHSLIWLKDRGFCLQINHKSLNQFLVVLLLEEFFLPKRLIRIFGAVLGGENP